MSRFVDLVTKLVREMGSYPPTPRGSRPIQERNLMRLDSNENPLGPSRRALEAIERALADSHLYPDNDSAALVAKVSDIHRISADQILVTAGSTGMLSLLCHTLLAPGLNAVTSQKSFIVYGMAVRATGAELIETPARNEGFDLAAILGAINDCTRLVLLANPNNPTGTMLGAEELDQFIKQVPDHAIVVLDEAYNDFAAHFAERHRIEHSRSLRYLRQGASVVVLRTFSKAHGLAGLRIGYGLGPAELISYCARMQDMYSVSSIAQAAALAALDDIDHVARSVSHNAEQAQILETRLSELGFRTVPTWANFVYCDLGEDAAAVSSRLLEKGISVRPLGAWGAPTCIRVSVGTAEQNEAFLMALSNLAYPSRAAP
ncbi:MAG TPA: histidinol-phosphate transaminase [Candidatus Sulfotelmatobacter sp.]|nr:histidinol-phosphate transaminase [Candidatus Sulfotelmatobacter sp.]